MREKERTREFENFLELVAAPIFGIYEIVFKPVGRIAQMALIVELAAAAIIGYVSYTAQVSRSTTYLLALLLLASHYIFYHFTEFRRERARRIVLEENIVDLQKQLTLRPDHLAIFTLQVKSILWDRMQPNLYGDIELTPSLDYLTLARLLKEELFDEIIKRFGLVRFGFYVSANVSPLDSTRLNKDQFFCTSGLNQVENHFSWETDRGNIFFTLKNYRSCNHQSEFISTRYQPFFLRAPSYDGPLIGVVLYSFGLEKEKQEELPAIIEFEKWLNRFFFMDTRRLFHLHSQYVNLQTVE